MSRNMQCSVWMLLVISIVLTGCGRKEMPQPATNPGDLKPQLVDFQYEQSGKVLKVTFALRGNPAGMGYQVDRTQIDPYCQCPGFWRRYIVQEPMAHLANQKTVKMIDLKTTKTEFVYRFRATDMNGNFGSWSKMIRARAIDLRK